MEIRPADFERDAEGVVMLLRDASPLIVLSREGWLHRARTIPERARQAAWVAVEEGSVVGNGWAFRSFFSDDATTAECTVLVARSHRRRGVGNALFEQVEEHLRTLGLPTALTSFEESEEGKRFASAHGFREHRAEIISALDVRTIDEAPPPDVDIRPLTAIDPRLAYVVDLEATQDMPSTVPIDDIPYDEWVGHVLDYPQFAAAGSYVAFVDGRPAAVSLLIADEESGRSANMFTGTARAYRGRGLGIAVKLASIRWAKEHGITQMATRNDESNAPMLAINRRLGFHPAGRRVEWLREETASSPAPPAPAT